MPAAANIRILADDCDVVGIDEAQFLTTKLFRFAMTLLTKGFVWLLLVWIWTTKATPLVPCPIWWLLQSMLPKSMPYARIPGISLSIVSVNPMTTIWFSGTNWWIWTLEPSRLLPCDGIGKTTPKRTSKRKDNKRKKSGWRNAIWNSSARSET